MILEAVHGNEGKIVALVASLIRDVVCEDATPLQCCDEKDVELSGDDLSKATEAFSFAAWLRTCPPVERLTLHDECALLQPQALRLLARAIQEGLCENLKVRSASHLRSECSLVLVVHQPPTHPLHPDPARGRRCM